MIHFNAKVEGHLDQESFLRFAVKAGSVDIVQIGRKLKGLLIMLIALTLLLPVESSAQPTSSPLPAATITSPQDPTVVERTHQFLSNKVLTFSERIDALIGKGQPVESTQESHVDLIFLSSVDQQGQLAFKTKLNSNFVLPRTQRRFNLILHNLGERYRDESIITHHSQFADAYKDPNTSVSGPSYSTAVRYMLLAERQIRANTDAGVRLTMPLDPYVQIKASQEAVLDAYSFNFSQEAHWFQSSGTAVSAGLRIDRPININFHLRQSNLITWTPANQLAEIEQGLSLYQLLPKERTITYFLSISGVNAPTLHATAYEMGTRFRATLFWPWLTSELTTMISYLEERQFVADPSFTLQIQARF